MNSPIPGLLAHLCTLALVRRGAFALLTVLLTAACAFSAGQAPAADSASPASPPVNAAPKPAAGPDHASDRGISEDEIRKLLQGKTLYLRDGYLDDTLSFNERGHIIGHSVQGSYTLSLIEINKVHLTKRRLEITGVRYGLHFLGARADEDSTKAVDRVRITPKKKVVKITIDRELVLTPKKKKHDARGPAPAENGANSSATTDANDPPRQAAQPAAGSPPEGSVKTEGVMVASSPAQAAQLLREAIDHIFAQSLDDGMIVAMPDFWKLY